MIRAACGQRERESIGAAAKTTATMTTTTTTTARSRLHRRAHRWETRQQLRRSPPLAILPTPLTIIVAMAPMIAVRIAVRPRPPPHARVLALGQIEQRGRGAPLERAAVGVAVEVAVCRVESHLLERLHLVNNI